MRFESWQVLLSLGFYLGIAAGFMLATVIAMLFYRLGISANVSQHAAKIAENARLSAEIALKEEQRRASGSPPRRKSAGRRRTLM